MNHQNTARPIASIAGSLAGGQPPRPRIHDQIDQLNKTLTACHDSASGICVGVDKIIGQQPQDASAAAQMPPVQTVEQRLQELIGYANNLSCRLNDQDQRLNSAV